MTTLPDYLRRHPALSRHMRAIPRLARLYVGSGRVRHEVGEGIEAVVEGADDGGAVAIVDGDGWIVVRGKH